MSFNWTEYHSLAQELAGQPVSPRPAEQEARLRAAISRAYYAVFCTARNHLRDKEGCTIPRKGVHKYVHEQFKIGPDQLRQQIGHALNRLHIDRCKADYDDTVGGVTQMAEADLLLVGQMLVSLQSL